MLLQPLLQQWGGWMQRGSVLLSRRRRRTLMPLLLSGGGGGKGVEGREGGRKGIGEGEGGEGGKDGRREVDGCTASGVSGWTAGASDKNLGVASAGGGSVGAEMLLAA